MIRDSPVLVLDEPRTGLDAASAERILTPLRRLMDGRTTLMISHNLLTVSDADQILYLEHGRITGAGTDPQLLARHPGYAHLFRLHQQPSPRQLPPHPFPLPGPPGANPGAARR